MDRVAVVTGASSGIGAATAARLARAGFVVYGGARRVDRLAALAGEGVHPLRLDLTQEESIRAFAEEVLAGDGRIDALVNVAGYGSYGAIEDVPIADARRQAEVNLFGTARLTQLVLPRMREQGSGRVVNVTSMGGRFAAPFGGWYHASKFGLEALSDSLRQEVSPFGIDVVVVEPGAIETEWSAIAGQSALAVSGTGAYADRVGRLAAMFSRAGSRLHGSRPEVVARTIERAVVARRPRTRYRVGAGATPMIALRRMLPDRAFDRVLRVIFP